VRTGGYGHAAGGRRAAAHPRAPCHPTSIQAGDSTYELLSLCGEPVFRDVREEQIAVAEGDGQRVAGASTVVLKETWTYDFGPARWCASSTSATAGSPGSGPGLRLLGVNRRARLRPPSPRATNPRHVRNREGDAPRRDAEGNRPRNPGGDFVREKIGQGLAKAAYVARLDGEPVDLSRPLDRDVRLEVVTPGTRRRSRLRATTPPTSWPASSRSSTGDAGHHRPVHRGRLLLRLRPRDPFTPRTSRRSRRPPRGHRFRSPLPPRGGVDGRRAGPLREAGEGYKVEIVRTSPPGGRRRSPSTGTATGWISASGPTGRPPPASGW